MSVIFLVSVVDDMVRYRRSISAQSLFFLNVLCSRTNSFFVFFFNFPSSLLPLALAAWLGNRATYDVYGYSFTHSIHCDYTFLDISIKN